MYRHILIATDGSELADKGLEHGFALAQALGAKVTILSVTEPISWRVRQAALNAGVEDPAGRYDQTINEEMKTQFASIRQRAKEKGVVAELMHEVDEHPAEAIVRLAARENYDLIVMSSHGRRGIRRFILGSQTAEVVAHTTIPVLVIR
jgi:nucleotide-binding universal stress UspA family protein